jgi:two-component system sensor histidine kinase/response regulator
MAEVGIDIKKVQELVEREKRKQKSHTVMIVDDEPDQLKELEALLEDYNVIPAHDGQEALDIIKRMDNPEEISLIISDQRMPNLTGVQLFEKLVDTLPHTIRILFTGYKDIPVISDAAARVRIHQLYFKPFTTEALLHNVEDGIKYFDRALEQENYKKELENKLDQRILELETVNKQKSSIYRIIEHDMRDALRSFSFADTLYAQYDSYDDLERKEKIKEICKAKDRISKLIDETLNLASQ